MKPVKRLGVLKYRFYYYSGMAKPTGQETIATEKRVYYIHSSPKKGMSHIVGGPMGEEPGLVRGRGRGNWGQELCCGLEK